MESDFLEKELKRNNTLPESLSSLPGYVVRRLVPTARGDGTPLSLGHTTVVSPVLKGLLLLGSGCVLLFPADQTAASDLALGEAAVARGATAFLCPGTSVFRSLTHSYWLEGFRLDLLLCQLTELLYLWLNDV